MGGTISRWSTVKRRALPWGLPPDREGAAQSLVIELSPNQRKCPQGNAPEAYSTLYDTQSLLA